MDLKVTRWEVHGDGVGLLVLDRPQRHNAWTGRMEQEYRWLLHQADDDPDVRVVVITGAGSAFCVGADSAALEKEAAAGAYDTGVREPLAEPGRGVRPDFDHEHTFLLGMRKPVIAAINGATAGVGLVVACFADIRLAAAGARMATAHGSLGLPAEFGLAWILPRLVGASRAADLLLSGRKFTAEEAGAMGLVSQVVEADRLLEHALDHARTMSRTQSPESLLATKRQLWCGLLATLDEAAVDARARLEQMMGQPDFAEGVAAFTERRRPRFGPLPRP